MLEKSGKQLPILKTYIETKTLRKLADHLPLDTPFTVGIDPSNRCNFRCSFCPTGHKNLLRKIKRPIGIMEYDLFKHIIDGMKGFPRKVKRLYLYHEGEPLLNPHLTDMLSYARKSDVSEMLQLTTNAALLTQEKADALLDADIDLIRVSIEHVDDEGYKYLTGTKTTYETVRRNVAYLYEARERRGSRLQIHSKIMDTRLAEEQKEKFRHDFGPISDLLNIQYLGQMPSAEGVDFTLGTNPSMGSGGSPFQPLRQVCPHPFYVMVVKWRGEVVTCSEEWRWENIVGDVRMHTLPEIWNSEALLQFRLTHLRGKRDEIPHCRHCPSVKGFPLENDLDEDAERLRKIYECSKTIKEPLNVVK